MKHEFVIREKGELKTYTRWEDLPESFEYVIRFNPHMPPPPHTDEEHHEIESWQSRFKELLTRQKGL